MSGPNRERVEVGSIEEMHKRLPNRWVAFEVTKVEQGVGITGAVVIASGSKRREEFVIAQLEQWKDSNPGKKFGLVFTGRFVKPGVDIINSPII